MEVSFFAVCKGCFSACGSSNEGDDLCSCFGYLPDFVAEFFKKGCVV